MADQEKINQIWDKSKESRVTDWKDLPTIQEQYNSTHPFADKISLWQGDITKLIIEAIVNSTNSTMQGGLQPGYNSVNHMIHEAAGPELQMECNHLMDIRRNQFGPRYEEVVGLAMLTRGYGLPAEYVIHTVAPHVKYGITDPLRDDLRRCYHSALQSCLVHGIKSVAFPCIATGEAHFPGDLAASIAMDTITLFLKQQYKNMDRIVLNVYRDGDLAIYERLI